MIRRRRNKVTGLSINGIRYTDEVILKQEAFTYFKRVFQSQDPCSPHCLTLCAIPQISAELCDNLLRAVTIEEVKDVVFSMSPYKAPGLDGFQPVFFHSLWHIVVPNVWNFASNVFLTGVMDKRLAETLIVPIPKVDDPTNFKEFRPISLCNVLSKIVSKVLVKCIRPYLDEFIGPLQSSFIPKRGTADNALIAQELVHQFHRKKGKRGYLFFKIDFEKAYDRVDWEFPRLTLTEFGFPIHIVDLIMNCITSSILSLKWNNEKLNSFTPNRSWIAPRESSFPIPFCVVHRKASFTDSREDSE